MDSNVDPHMIGAHFAVVLDQNTIKTDFAIDSKLEQHS